MKGGSAPLPPSSPPPPLRPGLRLEGLRLADRRLPALCPAGLWLWLAERVGERLPMPRLPGLLLPPRPWRARPLVPPRCAPRPLAAIRLRGERDLPPPALPPAPPAPPSPPSPPSPPPPPISANDRRSRRTRSATASAMTSCTATSFTGVATAARSRVRAALVVGSPPCAAAAPPAAAPVSPCCPRRAVPSISATSSAERPRALTDAIAAPLVI